MAEPQEKQRRKKIVEEIEKCIQDGVALEVLSQDYNVTLVEQVFKDYNADHLDLFVHARNGNVEAVRQMLPLCKTPNIFDHDNNSLLLIASMNEEVTRMLLDHPLINTNLLDNYGDTVLAAICISEKKRPASVVRLVAYHPQTMINIKGEQGYTALMNECHRDADIEVIKLFMEHPQFDPNIYNNSRQTILHIIAKSCQNIEIFRLILNHPKTNPCMRCSNGRLAYEYIQHPGQQKQWKQEMMPFIRRYQGLRGLFIICRPDLPVLPKEVWREIQKRRFIMESDNIWDLRDLAEEFCGIPQKFEIFRDPEKLKLASQIVKGLCMDVLRTGQKYSEQVDSYLRRFQEIGKVATKFYEFKAALSGVNIDYQCLDQDGNVTTKRLHELEREMARGQIFQLTHK